jgi:type VI secretion system secreted protein Hcp
MALNMYLKISGETLTIDGESKASGFAGWIDVLAWSWGVSNSGAILGGTGMANVQDLSLTKYMEGNSPNLALACMRGDHFPSAELRVFKAGANPVEVSHFKLTDVLVTSLSTGGSGGEDKLTENITLNFGHFDWSAPKIDPATGDTVSMTNVGWDISTNTSS